MTDELLARQVRLFIFEHFCDHGAAPADASASLTADEVHALGMPIYAREFELDYARPSRGEMLAHRATLGLTGEYWTG